MKISTRFCVFSILLIGTVFLSAIARADCKQDVIIVQGQATEIGKKQVMPMPQWYQRAAPLATHRYPTGALFNCYEACPAGREYKFCDAVFEWIYAESDLANRTYIPVPKY